ncbi:TetR/AcrR family transcriptional regulator [Sinorhizobium meliloti]|uniref:Transcriptional regulator, TetR family n=2 Tax=Rhizobium meliloti TaxID=382 RepID=F7XFH3_SINMM|nr:Transcriptional regulator, TetR family [Sinorhizobium meliloti SM11]ARS67323.1 TetR family transcriptional regulator [Sinorhizobium meliloti RU11/001]MQW78775.1 TetR family transcriptional regulator [Sinorhizobium meliloti]RVG66197.1 TetR/AcrR family transcriptional regulator [Sinorhizobium meliloti]RVG93055.1 TetR/AcrR family transcriptional regulator [Sinorhizobium meliloti]
MALSIPPIGRRRTSMIRVRRRGGGRPTREEAEALTSRLLDSARSTFARKGIANASMEEIAAELGISKHTLYRRYPNRQALLEAVVERDLVRFRKTLAEAAGQGDAPLAALRDVAFRYFRFGTDRDYSAFYLSVTAEAVFSLPLRERLAVWSSAALEPIVQAIISAQAAGLVVPGPAIEICHVLIDLLEGANNRVRLGLSESPDAADSLRLFESRWAIFQTAMRPGSNRPLDV